MIAPAVVGCKRVLDRVPIRVRKRTPFLRPFPSEEKFLNAVGMKQVVQSDMPKHDEHRVVTVLTVLGRSGPYLWRERPEPHNECSAIIDIPRQGGLEVHAQKHVVRLVTAWVVRRDDWRRVRKNLIEPIGVQSVHPRQMAGMLVGGPLRGTRPSFEYGGRDFSH
jgi:hypothetical protein